MDKEMGTGYQSVSRHDEKQAEVAVTVNDVPSSSSRGNPWRPGFFARLPWKAFISIFGAILCLIGAIILICMIQDKDQWTSSLTPNIVASLFATFIGLLTRVALYEGLTISWWKAAIRGARVDELHNRWEFGHSAMSSILAGSAINSVAVASLLALLVSANGALFQKTIQVVKVEVARPKEVIVPVSQALSFGNLSDGLSHPFYSGFVGKPNSSDANSMPLQSYTNYFRDIERRAVFFENVTVWGWEGSQCNGTCNTFIPGFGFKPVGCQETYSNFDLSLNTTTDSVDIFSVNITYGDFDYNRSNGASGFASNAINVSIVFRDWDRNGNLSSAPGCRGVLTHKTCQFMAAHVNYSASVLPSAGLTTFELNLNNFTSEERKSFNDPDQYGDRIDMAEKLQQGYSSIAGFALSMRNRFSARATVAVDTDVTPNAWKITRVGVSASGHVKNGFNSSGFEVGGCQATSSDPFDDIHVALRDLAFRTSMAIPFISQRGDGSNAPPLPVHDFFSTLNSTEKKIILKYAVNRAYLWPAVAGTIIAVVAIFCLFPGWSEVGRNTTLSPIETARAFNAPYLQSRDPNAEVEELVKEIGDRKMQYGVSSNRAGGASGAQLEIANADLVVRPAAGERFNRS